MSEHESDVRGLEDLFAYDLAAAYDMELKLVDALAEMSRKTTDADLEKGFAIHRTETERQVENVEAAFEALGAEPTRRDDPIVDGLLEDRARFDARVTDGALRDVRYLTVATKTERVEISSYEGLLETAERAGLGEAVTAPLAANLAQEEKTLGKLRALAGESGLERVWRRLTGP